MTTSMSEDWRDVLASAQARGDQQMAAMRDLETPLRLFGDAAVVLYDALTAAGVDRNARMTTVVTMALGVGLSADELGE
jgi:hypothetical protein